MTNSDGAEKLTITIDGPAASGKSTLGAALAERLGYRYFDSGVVYRAFTWLALRLGVDVHDEAALVKMAEHAEVEAHRPHIQDGRQFTVLVNGEDVTWAIRSPQVDHNVSLVAAHPGVRRVANDGLRHIAADGAIVMVGRDIGTVVLPDADLKVFLTASGKERARRRHAERMARNLASDFDEILAEMQRRDALDSGREAAPLRPADDAIILDSNHLTVEEELAIVLRQLATRQKRAQEQRA
jgi:CMP/dCMP kinase